MKETKFKLKMKNIKILGIVLLIIIAILLFKPTVNIFSLMGKNYSFSEAFDINNSGLSEKIIKKGYNKIVANNIKDKNFKKENLDVYYKIKYYDNKEFLINVNKLISQGYDSKEIDIINEKKDNEINEYLTNNYVEHIDEWLKYDYFKGKNIERYLKNFDGNYKDTIIKVNIGLDKEFYQDVNIIKEFSIEVLANKYNKLDPSFVPKELTTLTKCSGSNHFLSIEAKNAYDKLCDASINDGMNLSITSSYRGYESQQEIYDTYLKLYGQSYVDKYVATPGYSEHQTGLALDVKSLNSNIFKNSKEYKWMIDNSYKYGFILRYPENKNDITGYNSEAWHFRYVGVEAATYIKENNITYEEYYVMFLDK